MNRRRFFGLAASSTAAASAILVAKSAHATAAGERRCAALSIDEMIRQISVNPAINASVRIGALQRQLSQSDCAQSMVACGGPKMLISWPEAELAGRGEDVSRSLGITGDMSLSEAMERLRKRASGGRYAGFGVTPTGFKLYS